MGGGVAHEHAVANRSAAPTDSGVSWEGCECGAVRRVVNGVVDRDAWHACSICSSQLVMTVDTQPCPRCGGDGWFGRTDHHSTCDGDCIGLCPVEVQVECEECRGRGRVPCG